jgi:hypothetical protein
VAGLSTSAAVFPLGNVEKNPSKFHLIVNVWNAQFASDEIPANFPAFAHCLCTRGSSSGGRPG